MSTDDLDEIANSTGENTNTQQAFKLPLEPTQKPDSLQVRKNYKSGILGNSGKAVLTRLQHNRSD